jgi:peptidoglycan/LPS O-acetylase OafA/YrhL
VLLGARPDIATAPQWIVTAAALPVCVIVAFVLTRLIEQPLTTYGRSWAWSKEQRPR